MPERRRGRVLHNIVLSAFVLGLGVSITLSETALALLSLEWLYRLATTRSRETYWWPLWAPFLAWVIVSLLAAVFSGDPATSLVVAGKGILLIATFYVMLDALKNVDAAERFLAALFVIMVGVSLVGLAEVAFCGRLTPTSAALAWLCRVPARSGRATGFFSIYMTFAGVLSLTLLAVLPRLLSPASAAVRRAGIIAWLVSAVAFAVTYVRGAWVGLVVGIAVLIGLLRRGRALLAVATIVVVIALLFLPGVRRRVESIADPTDVTTQDRLYMWQSGLAMVRDHPLFGVGPGGVKREYPRYALPQALHKHRGHLHNTPLQILVERGIIGLAAWLAIWIGFFGCVGRILRHLPLDAIRERRLTVGALAAVAAFLVGGLTEYNFGDSEVVLVAYAIMALPFVVARAEDEKRRKGAPPRDEHVLLPSVPAARI